MSGRACKAAIDCTGFLYELDRTVDLILHGHIDNHAAIDAFNEMKAGFEQRYERWKEKYVDFDAN